jgi:hypothetical protein
LTDSSKTIHEERLNEDGDWDPRYRSDFV